MEREPADGHRATTIQPHVGPRHSMARRTLCTSSMTKSPRNHCNHVSVAGGSCLGALNDLPRCLLLGLGPTATVLVPVASCRQRMLGISTVSGIISPVIRQQDLPTAPLLGLLVGSEVPQGLDSGAPPRLRLRTWPPPSRRTLLDTEKLHQNGVSAGDRHAQSRLRQVRRARVKIFLGSHLLGPGYSEYK